MTLDLEIHSDDPASQLSFEQLLYLLNKRLAAGNIQDAGVGTSLITDLAVTTPKRQLLSQISVTVTLTADQIVSFNYTHNLGVRPLIAMDVQIEGGAFPPKSSVYVHQNGTISSQIRVWNADTVSHTFTVIAMFY